MASWRKRGLYRRKLIVALIYKNHTQATTRVAYDSCRSLVYDVSSVTLLPVLCDSL
jgi:hypothetical protein